MRDKKRRELNIEKRTVIGHVGRFCTVKNHRFVLEIFAEYLKRDYNAVLLLIGDGPLKAEIETRAESLGISRNVVFTGNRDDVPELYNAMDLVLLPSLYEGLPMVGVEAQANGLPVIMSDRVPREAKLSGSVSFLPLILRNPFTLCFSSIIHTPVSGINYSHGIFPELLTFAASFIRCRKYLLFCCGYSIAESNCIIN